MAARCSGGVVAMMVLVANSALLFLIDLLIVGTGPRVAPLAPATREAINALGIRVEVQDTRNAAAQYNLLATERGATQVAAALVPVGWLEGGGKRGS